jgi:alkylhydroperoxidase/carboxymuconolactone decarboxylase family protein YurZ
VSARNPYYVELHDAFPALEAAQSAWMSQIDSLTSPDRKTHELIRLACTVILRNGPGVERHAKLAAEVGATWDEIAGAVILTQPGFGLLPAVEAMHHARRGFESAEAPEAD